MSAGDERAESVLRMAERVVLRMRDEGGNFEDVEEYVDDLIAFTRGNHPELDEDERWRVIRVDAVLMTRLLLGVDN